MYEKHADYGSRLTRMYPSFPKADNLKNIYIESTQHWLISSKPRHVWLAFSPHYFLLNILNFFNKALALPCLLWESFLSYKLVGLYNFQRLSPCGPTTGCERLHSGLSYLYNCTYYILRVY
jgi:hypothetical protein